MSDTLLGVVGAFITVCITGLVSWRVAKQGAESVEAGLRAAPYDMLAARVSELECNDEKKGREIRTLRQRTDALAEDRDQLVEYIASWWAWWHAGAPPPPPPVPMHLRDVIPPTIWQIITDPEHKQEE